MSVARAQWFRADFFPKAMLSWVGSGAPATVERSDQDDHLPEDQGCFFDGQPVDERR